MTTLFPPILENQRESIWFYGPAEKHEFGLRFQMPTINDQSQDIKHVQISLKYKSTNRPAVNTLYSPDNATLFFSLGKRDGSGMPATALDRGWEYDEVSKICTIYIPYRYFDGANPKNGCEYTAQIRFGSNYLWDEFSGDAADMGFHDGSKTSFQGFSYWNNVATSAVPSAFGEWSNVQKIFCIARAGTKAWANVGEGFVPTLYWTYSPSKGDNGEISDPIEQIEVRWDWNITDEFGQQIRQFRSQIFNGQFNGSDTYTFQQQIPIAPITQIHFSVTAITNHNTVYVDNANLNPFDDKGNRRIFNPTLVDCKFSDYELKDAQTDDGCAAKSVYFEKGHYLDTLQFYRYDLKTLDCVMVKSVQIQTKAKDGQGNILPGDISAIYTMKDYTIAMGEEYQYIPVVVQHDLQIPSEQRVMLCAPLEESGPGTTGYVRNMMMEMTFLNDRYHQLRIPGNLNVSSFKRNTSDQFQNTIGGKYPFYIRNGAQNYRTLSISAVISVNFDPTFTFLQLDDYYGLVWEDYDSRRLVIDKKDLFGIQDFSNSRWRLGHPNGDKRERAKLEALGNDAFEQWAILDGQLEGATIGLGRWLKGIYPDLTAEQAIEAIENGTDEARKTELAFRQKNIDNINDKMDEIYANRWVTSQQYAADYEGKTAYNQWLIRNTTTTIGTDHSDENVYIERKFRELVMDWLSDGKPKLYRSETEGNMIVMVSQPNFTPLNKTQRMVYSVSMTLTEVADYNLENLILYNLIPSQIISEHIPAREWDISFGNPDPWIKAIIGLNYEPKYDIPPIKIEDNRAAMNVKDIPMSPALVNAYYPDFLWDAEGLPKGFSIDPRTGIVSCDETAIEPHGRATAKIIVYDRWEFDADFDKYWSYRNYPDPSPYKDPNDYTDKEKKKVAYNKWWRKQMESRHDSAEMIINVGECYYNFMIGWSPTYEGALDFENSPVISVRAVGEMIDTIYFRVSPTSPGKPPYTWGIADESLPLGLNLQVTGENSQYCTMTGVFLQEIAYDGSFEVTCTDSKYQTQTIIVYYKSVHLPVQLVTDSRTETLNDWEENCEIPKVNYRPQRRYGIGPQTDDPATNKFKFQLLYLNEGDTPVEGPSNVPGIWIDEDTGVLQGTPQKGALDYPVSGRTIVIRVYDLGDPVPADPNADDRARWKDGNTYRKSEIRVDVNEILEEFVFIKPKDIDPYLYGSVIQVGTVWPNESDKYQKGYQIMQVKVDDDGNITDSGRPPVRGGRSRIHDPKPYEFYAIAPVEGGILGNFSVSSSGRFAGTMVQTSPPGYMRIYAVDGRGKEKFIEVRIPEVTGKFRIVPNPKDKMKIGATWVGNPADQNREWFRLYAKQNPDGDGSEGNLDDLQGEYGDFNNFKISVEGLPLGIQIKRVQASGNTPPYFSFVGAPVSTNLNELTEAQFNGYATQLAVIDWDRYVTDPSYRNEVAKNTQDYSNYFGSGAHYATVKIQDDFKYYLDGDVNPILAPRTATHSILVEGVAPPFIWYGERTIEKTTTDACAYITPIELPAISGGKAPYRWTEESVAALSPYYPIPDTTDSNGGFGEGEKLYIVGIPNKARPAGDVTLELVDANGNKQSITVHVGEITGVFNIQRGKEFPEEFIVNHSNADNGDIRVAYPYDLSGDVTFRYKGVVNAELPNGMRLSKDGKLTGMATKECPRINIGQDITIEDDHTGKILKCPSYYIPATVPQPIVNPDLTLTGGEYVLKDLVQGYSLTTPPLFKWQGSHLHRNTAIDSGDTFPKEIGINQDTTQLFGNLSESTSTDLVIQMAFYIGGTYSVTPLFRVPLTVRFKPITTKFALGTPDSGFEIPGLSVGIPMKPIILSQGLVGGSNPITWEVSGHEPYGITIKTTSPDGRELTMSGTPTKKSDGPFEITIRAKDATGQVTDQISYRVPGIFDKLVYKGPNPIVVPAGTSGAAFTKIKLQAEGGSGKSSNYEWKDEAGLMKFYGLTIKTTNGEGVISGADNKRGEFAMGAETSVIILRDTETRQVVEIPIKYGATTTGKSQIYPESNTLPEKPRKTPVTINLRNFLTGTDAEKNKVSFEIDVANPIPNDWKKNASTTYGIQLSGSTISGTYPNKMTAASSFKVVAKRDGQAIGNLTIYLPAVA